MDALPPHRSVSLGKLSAPRRGLRFDRERLFACLDRMAEAPGLWIGAPPGAGKTTLAATWAQRRGDPVLWLQADAGDADPATFAGWLDALWEAHLLQPAALAPPGADDLGDFVGWLRRRLRRLLPLLPPRWLLVIDNHHELPPASPLQSALAAALDELPPGVHWLFLSRELPPSAFAPQLARQQLQLLDADAMRLDEQETRALIRLHGRSESLLEALAPANGWAAGLTLMLLGAPAGGYAPAPAARERLFDYFAGEVMSRLPEHEQQALYQLACLPVASSELALALTGDSESSALLERLAQASFFVDRRDAARAVYVVHPLFRQFLLRRHEQVAAAAQVLDTRLRAGRLLLLAGDLDSGLQLLLDAKAWDEAALAMRERAPEYFVQGRLQSLQRLIDILPAGHASALAFWRGVCLLDTRPEDALADATRARHQALVAGDARGQLAAVAVIMAALVALGRLPALDPWIDALEVLEPEAEPALMDRELGPCIVPGLVTALVFRRPWHPWTRRLAELGDRLLHQPVAPGQRLLLGSLTFYFLWQGEQERLTRILLRIDALCLDPDAAPSALMRWWGVGTLIKTLIGRVDSADADVQRMLATVAAEPGVASQRVNAELQACFVALGRGDSVAARHRLDRAARVLDPDDDASRTMFEHFHALVALAEDDRPAALRLARDSVESGRRSGFVVREHIALINHALAAACNGLNDEAETTLQQVHAHPLVSVCHWHRWIGSAVAAYAALRRGDRALALQRVREAFAVAHRHGYRAGPQLRAVPELLPRLSALALQADVEADFARELVAHHRLPAPPDADPSWPWRVRVRVLGGFDVQVDGAPLPASRKQSRRLLELLRLLAAHGTSGLSQERVADELWPDTDGDAAHNALDNLLHRLRRALGGDGCVLLRHGVLSLDPQCCWTDVDALERATETLAHLPVDELPPALDALRALYRGPLLPDDTQALVAVRRAALRRRVQGAVTAAQRRLEQAGQRGLAQAAAQHWTDTA